MINPETPFTDLTLESQIDIQALALATALTPDERRTAWDELKRLHGMRSPERIADMEQERGLR